MASDLGLHCLPMITLRVPVKNGLSEGSCMLCLYKKVLFVRLIVLAF